MGPKSFEVPEGYDKMARPYKNGPPCNVTVGITIKRIADVNDKEGSCVFDLLIFTQWRDPRLKDIAFKRILPKDVWTPGLFVSNEGKEPEWFSSDMVLNKDGRIVYERRVLVTVNTHSNFTISRLTTITFLSGSTLLDTTQTTLC